MSDIKENIKSTDALLVSLLKKRLELAEAEAKEKSEKGLPLYDRESEDAAVNEALANAGDYAEYAKSFMNVVIGLSKRAASDSLASK